MKKVCLVLLMASSLALAAYAEAAQPKKRGRNANRVGAYGAVFAGLTSYGNDHSGDEQSLIDSILGQNTEDVQNLRTSTDDSDLGYQAAFGYRFTRYFAAELGLAQFGELVSTANADIDFGDGLGLQPSTLTYSFRVGGPILSAVGILPLGEHFELFAKLGYLFASSEREVASRVAGQPGGVGSANGDSQLPVYVVGASWNINQVYSIRGEYQKLTDVGQSSRTGTEDLDVIALGLMIRF